MRPEAGTIDGPDDPDMCRRLPLSKDRALSPLSWAVRIRRELTLGSRGASKVKGRRREEQ